MPLITLNLSPQREIMETLQPTAKEKPTDARFESSRNLKAEQDTTGEAPSSVAGLRGKERAQPVRPKSQARAPTAEGKKIMTFSAEDLRREERAAMPQGTGALMDSAGFNERLKKARELKISAVESDRGQFITRMQRKISQHWSPLKTVTSSMYNYDSVSVEIAVVLNQNGEVVNLMVTNPSLFSGYDQETVRALQEASPYPNPPDSLVGQDGLVLIPWQFTLHLRRAVFGVH